MTAFLESVLLVRDIFWGGPLLIILITVGIWQTFSLRAIQFRYLGHALKNTFFPISKSNKNIAKIKGDLSSFQSLMTALAGTIGTGSITGIATAVATGGFGSLFWMWVIAFLGMATAYSETVLAVKYRRKNNRGEIAGGPMYVLLHGCKAPYLAFIFAFFGAIAVLGIGGLVQSNSVVDALDAIFVVDRSIVGIILAIITGMVILGGIKKIGKIAAILVPFMAITYLLIGLYVIFYNFQNIGDAFHLIIASAFSPQAAIGAFAGSSVIMGMRMGAANGVFANEAGLGSLAIAGSNAKCSHPSSQGFFAISGVFISTMIICTITGLVLAVTGVLGQELNGKLLSGSPLILVAFSSVVAEFKYIVLISLSLFAFTTLLVWAYYGEKCAEYLLGEKFAYYYKWVYIISIVFGAILELDLVWALSHIMSGLMALPNLIAVIKLSKIVKAETNNYIKNWV